MHFAGRGGLDSLSVPPALGRELRVPVSGDGSLAMEARGYGRLPAPGLWDTLWALCLQPPELQPWHCSLAAAVEGASGKHSHARYSQALL